MLKAFMHLFQTHSDYTGVWLDSRSRCLLQLRASLFWLLFILIKQKVNMPEQARQPQM